MNGHMLGFHPHDGLEGLTDDGGDDGGSSTSKSQ